ncbi:MAG TPA: RHS repeat-associated core domain-containing protein, partial [Ktedonobacteraceae bacterium]|nr:RHS repeat-associated core domain-containing protein [Ktedonobacteraceae bacterium]
FNRLTQWDAGSNGQEQYVYDVSGNRVLKRSTSGGTTSLTAYAFGLQERNYTGNGVATGQIAYDSLAGHLVGSTDGSSTTDELTDAQGSVLTSISQSAVLGEQVYGPYGNQRYVQGTLGTTRGYTGQFHDGVTGLDYYNARYYDPAVAMFVSPDSVQGNAQGMDPYAYVAGNPESRTDPTGQRFKCEPDDTRHCSPDGNPTKGGCPGGQVPKGGKCVTPPPNVNDCKAIHEQLEGGKCVPYTTASIKKGKEKASETAAHAANMFATLANLLGIIALALGFLATALLSASFWNPLLLSWGLLVAGIAAGLGILAYKASQISNLFNQEVANGLSWFTLANVSRMKGQMLVTLAGWTIPSLGTGFVMDKIGIIVKQSIMQSPLVVKDLTAVGAFPLGGTAFTLTDVVGTVALAGLVAYYEGQQESAVLT